MCLVALRKSVSIFKSSDCGFWIGGVCRMRFRIYQVVDRPRNFFGDFTNCFRFCGGPLRVLCPDGELIS